MMDLWWPVKESFSYSSFICSQIHTYIWVALKSRYKIQNYILTWLLFLIIIPWLIIIIMVAISDKYCHKDSHSVMPDRWELRNLCLWAHVDLRVCSNTSIDMQQYCTSRLHFVNNRFEQAVWISSALYLIALVYLSWKLFSKCLQNDMHLR